MKKFFRALLMLLAFIFVGSMFGGCSRVGVGFVGIKVNQYGSYKGVQDIPIVTGTVAYNPFTEDIYQFPTFLQNRVWTKNPNEGSDKDESISFNTVKGAAVNCDISVSTQFDPSKVPALYISFHETAEQIVDIYVRSIVRNAFSEVGGKMDVIEIMGKGKTDLEDQVKEIVNDQLKPKGISIDQLSIVGHIRVDKNVEDSINRVIQAQQDAQAAEAKVSQAKAEAEQKVAEAEGNAKSYQLQTRNLNSAILKKMAIERWDGHFPQVMGSGSMPFIKMSDIKADPTAD